MGPIQKQWIENLRNHPERQTSSRLGHKLEGGDYKACCLGEGLLTYCRMKHLKLPFVYNDFNIINNISGIWAINDGTVATLQKSYEKLGLRNAIGSFKKPIEFGDIMCYSLTQVNDIGITWPKIADIIEQHEKLIFTKEV